MTVLHDTPPPRHERNLPLDREWTADREIDFFVAAMFLWRRRYVLLLGMAAGLAIGFLATLRMPPEYTASATVVGRSVRPDAVRSAVLSIDAIDQIARSGSLRGRVEAELARRGLQPEGQRLLELRTAVHQSPDPLRATLPMLALTVVATAPELARDAANVWSEQLVAAARSSEQLMRSEGADLVASEYPKAAERLAREERELEELIRRHQKALLDARNRAAVSLKESELASHERLVVEFEEERRRLTLAATGLEASVAALEEELGRTAPLLQDARPGAEPVANPVYAALAGQLADARVERRRLAARRSALEAEIEKLRRGASATRAAVTTAGNAIAELELRQETERFARERQVSLARDAHDRLAAEMGRGELLATIDAPALEPGLAAELPAGASGPETLGRLLAGLAAGFLLALAGSWFLETARARGVRLT